ncbi:G-protein coupled receptor 22 [Lethenteron reissneri]|uniref:G-protein coupled receptor 22 n=1 Tax=Lethenteron reissneri TaxID=7753 RepID=UPI002AB65A07|nr:G-protein coupled receptor 22 [Lethenteron reissneri]XP_061418863.1 G-protein coupled receptor 22 [Lethenteron reissneri]XP_061418864.1 G-protein coupled receptor 22 [Lethenteron reissneri]XP_061418865.1 G-protein coupled receptor 22 [Lethenteron reissneri]XP_061418866.1 G-protein coupled receptor 22 [Lethenteron reissneri]
MRTRNLSEMVTDMMSSSPIPPGELAAGVAPPRDNSSASEGPSYPLALQVALTSLLTLEIVLGLGSNLIVLALYCAKSGLVGSVSNAVTVSLHVFDVLICLGCVPLTVALLLSPLERSTPLLCCSHEAATSFAGVATAASVLVISIDRYDISVRPANRVLTPARAGAILAIVWALSFLAFLIPFLEVSFFMEAASEEPNSKPWQNKTLLCVNRNEYHKEMGMYYHLLVQVPFFAITTVVMLVTYSKILQALNIKIGSRFSVTAPKRKKKKPGKAANKKRKRTAHTASTTSSGHRESTLSHSSGAQNNAPMGVRTSVSVILALKRAVKRHRERRERQKRVFRMSLIIISTFLVCWTPISVLNTVILCMGPSDVLVKIRLCFLAMAYGTTIFHPLLYAFTRQKFQKVLKNKMKKRVVSVVEVDQLPPHSGAVIHNSWIEPQRNRKVKYNGSNVTDKCVTEVIKE